MRPRARPVRSGRAAATAGASASGRSRKDKARGGESRPSSLRGSQEREGVRAYVRVDETASESHRDRLRARVDSELGEDVLDVRRDGLRADHELGRDLTLRAPFGEKSEDLALPWAQAGRVWLFPVSVAVSVRGCRRRAAK